LKPDLAEAHSNLGANLKELDRFEESEASCRQAIALKPDLAEAHSNLGNSLKELDRFEEAEVSYRQAIALKPDLAEAHSNLGANLKELDRLEEAEASCRQAIALKPEYARAHINLGIILYANGDLDSALENMEKANSINPKSKSIRLLLTVLQIRKTRETTEISVDNINNSGCDIRLTSNPLILNRAVESELITNLYKIKSLELDKIRDPSYGNARGSGYNLFKDDRSIIKTVAEDLVSIITEAIKADVYIEDSFFTILGAGGGVNRHNHVDRVLDSDSILNLANQKYSLVYYLSIGDQDCSEPGILKLYDPSENILPCEGMITIFPADRYHSVVYNGKKDRVIIGINFYSL
jgi:Flp pilus assembly protein TadD